MTKMEADNRMGQGRSSAGDSGPTPFTLWREVLVAYLAPALMAGAGGVVGGQPDLVVAACTSIAGTSAIVAALVGGRLRRVGVRRTWLTSTPRVVPPLVLATAVTALAALVGWFVAGHVPERIIPHHGSWPDRLRLDLPLSAALATTIVTWRWRGAMRDRRPTA
ncbi:hypothetical protein [Embleya sp. NPDC005575]|uniref:hypothetical protein n=1 Tax=Embleya sp. NPDC005575 TaxID=3156892 RepID=UPI0033AB73B7